MPSSICGYAFRRPEAQLLADLSVVQSDLEHVRRFLEPISTADRYATFRDPDLMELHWMGALVRYARPFSTGVLRWGRDQALAALSPDERELHDYFLDIRNGYIAHSVGQMEDFVPSVQICSHDDGSHDIQAVQCNHSRILCGSEAEVCALLGLVVTFERWLNAAVSEEKVKLLAIARTLDPMVLIQAGMWRGEAVASAPRIPRRPFTAP